MLSLQIILGEKSLIFNLLSLKISYKQNQDTEVNWKIFTSKEGKKEVRRMRYRTNFFREKHENEVEAERKTAHQAKMSIIVYLTL